MGNPAVRTARFTGGFILRLAVPLLILAACSPDPAPLPTGLKPQSPTVVSSPAPSLTPTQLSSQTAPEATGTSPVISPTSLPTATEKAPVQPISPKNASLLAQVGEIRFDPWDLVLMLTWSPDGNWLAVSAGNSIFLYDGLDLTQQQVIPVGSWTSGLAFSPDGSSLAAGSRDGEIRVWRKTAGRQPFDPQPVLRWTAHKKGINLVDFSPDGTQLASGGNDAIARVWRSSDGSLEQQMIGGTFAVPALAFQPDGRFLAVVNGPLARLRALDSGRIGTTLRGEVPIISLDFSPDGSRIVSGNLENQLEFWDADTGERIAVLDTPRPVSGAPTAFSGQVIYSPDGSLVAATASDGSIRLWEVDSGRLNATLSGHNRAATCLAFSPDQTRLVSGGLDATIRIWGLP